MIDLPGTIAIPTGDLLRYSEFAASLLATDLPRGARMLLRRGPSIADNLNVIAQDTLRHADNAWLWILGDDHCWPHTLLTELLARLDPDTTPIVAPVVCRRKPPYTPVVYGQAVDGQPHHYRGVQWPDLPGKGLLAVPAAGTAGMLVHRRVWETLPAPWFEYTGPTMGEDLYFCEKAQAAGFPVHVACDLVMGHATVTHLIPHWTGQRWEMAFALDDNWEIRMDMTTQVGRIETGGLPR